MIDLSSVSETSLIVIGAIVALAFFLKGLYLIGPKDVGIVTRRMAGKKMPQGQVIARHGEIGIQANVLVPGLYWRMPVIWNVKKTSVIEIPEDKVGTVESIDGRPLPSGRILGDTVDCNKFQDAEQFLENNGYKGPQVDVLPPGIYRINTMLFRVSVADVTVVDSDQTGIVTALDGKYLPANYIIAPRPAEVA